MADNCNGTKALLLVLLNKFAELDLKRQAGDADYEEEVEEFSPFVAVIGSALMKSFDESPDAFVDVLNTTAELTDLVETGVALLKASQ